MSRGRPSYPPEALDWLLPDGARTVLDVGAGTDKLTRDLVARGFDGLAVDSSEGMRAELGRALPDLTVLAGAGECRARSTRLWWPRPGTGSTR